MSTPQDKERARELAQLGYSGCLERAEREIASALAQVRRETLEEAAREAERPTTIGTQPDGINAARRIRSLMEQAAGKEG